MSTQSIVNLMEDASFYLDEWAGTIMQGLLEADLANEDWESLHKHINEARKMSFDRDYHPTLEPRGFADVN